MFNIGFNEALIIFLVALIVLGPEKLPEIGRFLARLSLELKKAVDEFKRELELEDLEENIKEAKEEVEKLKEGISNPTKLLTQIDSKKDEQTSSS